MIDQDVKAGFRIRESIEEGPIELAEDEYDLNRSRPRT